jgi:hypothetical protein
MFERHSSECSFDLFGQESKIVEITTDGAANMTASDRDAVSHIVVFCRSHMK